MKTRSYMVVWLPKDDEVIDFGTNFGDDQQMFNDYDEAFDTFNAVVHSAIGETFRQPKGEQPIRASLPYQYLELWIIERTTDLIK